MSVVNAVHNLITGRTVNAMREERPPVDDGINYQYGIGQDYDRIVSEMNDANDRYNKILEVHNG